jgi:hypothetical protein
MMWVVMSRSGTGYVEAWRGEAVTWFAALESVPPERRGDEMFVVAMADVRFVTFVDADPDLPDAHLVKVAEDGSLRRVRVAETVDSVGV